MVIKKGTGLSYLLDWKNGRIKMGLGINSELDNFIRFKPSQLVIILGHDNVGKTYWVNWYFLNLVLRHNLKIIIWSGENKHQQILRDLIQMYSGIPFKNLSEDEIKSYSMYLEQFYDFVDNSKLYKPNELLKIFEDSEANICLIDPFTGLDRDLTYEGNYKFLNIARQFVNKTGMSIYINTHPTSESGRNGNLYTEGDWKGHLRSPLPSYIEGGKAFLNRCDDMITIHRLVKHKEMRFYTMINIDKVKDVDTGGIQTDLNDPLLFEFNSGLGFKILGKDSLLDLRPKISLTMIEKKLNHLPF